MNYSVSSFSSSVPGNVLNQTCLFSQLREHWETLSLCSHTKDAVSLCWVKCHGLMRDYLPTHNSPWFLRLSILRGYCHFLTTAQTLTTLNCSKVRTTEQQTYTAQGSALWPEFFTQTPLFKTMAVFLFRADLLITPQNTTGCNPHKNEQRLRNNQILFSG